jgi:putative transposase
MSQSYPSNLTREQYELLSDLLPAVKPGGHPSSVDLWEMINCTRIEAERHPSPLEAVLDRQSVKSAAGVQDAVGYDAGKQIKGRKRFLSVDTLGLVLRVFVTAASTGERDGGKVVLQRVQQQGKAIARLHTIWVDGGFSGDPFMQWVITVCRWIGQVVLRPE